MGISHRMRAFVYVCVCVSACKYTFRMGVFDGSNPCEELNGYARYAMEVHRMLAPTFFFRWPHSARAGTKDGGRKNDKDG